MTSSIVQFGDWLQNSLTESLKFLKNCFFFLRVEGKQQFDLSEISVKFLLIHDSPSSHGNASHASIASIPSLRF